MRLTPPRLCAGVTAGWLLSVLTLHATGAPDPVTAVATVGDVARPLLVGGVPGGLLLGVLADDYAPVLKQGLFATAAGVLTTAVVVGAHGTALSLSRGFGADSLLSFVFTAPALVAFVVLVPVLALQGAVAAVVANEVRLRAARRGWV